MFLIFREMETARDLQQSIKSTSNFMFSYCGKNCQEFFFANVLIYSDDYE